MQEITTFLWFDQQAEEAVNFYVSIFKDSRIVSITRCGDVGPGPKGSALVIQFELHGQTFQALNGGPHFKFTEAISLSVDCQSQEEVDYYWSKLSAGGGHEVECGWLKDKYGLSWQIVPSILPRMLQDADTKKADRVMSAMMKMKKLDFAALQAAYDQK